MTFVNNQDGLNLVDGFLVFVRQRASASESAFNGRVQVHLFNMPGGNFQMLINLMGSVRYFDILKDY